MFSSLPCGLAGKCTSDGTLILWMHECILVILDMVQFKY